MQLIGLSLVGFVVWYGFADRDMTRISPFDAHALVMVLVGSFAAVLTSSSRLTTVRTFLFLRELVPGLARFSPDTDSLESERKQVGALWREGNRAQAVALAERSNYPAIKRMLELLLGRAPRAATETAFTELKHAELGSWQPAVSNWEMLSKLGPSFGMVGTITGMIQLFRNMGADNLNIGAAMSLALLATLYGVAFGAGIAGPIGHYLRTLLDERIGAIERCEQSVYELVSLSVGEARR